MKQLVIGWGNPIAGDDGIGIRASQLVSKRVHPEVCVTASSHSGLRLVEGMFGYDRVIIADARVGTPERGVDRTSVRPDSLPPMTSGVRHDSGLVDALRVMRSLNASDLPEEVVILSRAIPAPKVWNDELSVAGEHAAESLANAVIGELEVTAIVQDEGRFG